MSNTAVADVQSRIASIQQRIKQLDPQSASATTFSDTLATVLGNATSKATSALSSSYVSAAGDTSGSAQGDDIVNAAKKYLGVPYVWGGTSDSGLDCSGLVQKAYGDQGIQLPRVAADQARMGTAVASLDQAKPGDLVAFGSPVDHIGIYVGDHKMIVAPKRGDVVKIQDVYKTPTAIRRIVDDNGSGASASPSGIAAAGSNSSVISPSLHSKYDSLFVAAGAKYNLSPNLLAAVAKQESGFNPNAGSGAGAKGLMQLMPGTAQSLGVDPLDPAQAVDGGAKMLAGLVQKFGSVDLALAGYNAGPGNVSKYGGIPPFKETQNYVKNVLAMASGGTR